MNATKVFVWSDIAPLPPVDGWNICTARGIRCANPSRKAPGLNLRILQQIKKGAGLLPSPGPGRR
jgi:hypothetical protein